MFKAVEELGDSVQVSNDPYHLFVPGMYCRVLEMPAGTVWISKIHKTEHFCVALCGHASVASDEGVEEIIGPRLMITKPGTKRALFIRETAVWATFHPTDKTDVDEIEEDIIAKDFNDPDLLAYFNGIEDKT